MNTRQYYLRLLRTLVLAALTAAATAACSDDNGDPDGREPVTPDGGIPVSFTANINPGSDAASAAAPGTRTVLKPDGNGGFTVTWKGTDNNPTSGYDGIYIWAAQGTNMIGPKSYAPSISAASSPLEPKWEDSKLTLPSTGDWTFTAIYGYYEDQNGTIYSVIQNQVQSAPGNTEHIADKDFSVAIAQQNILDAGSEMPAVINFKFEHKLSALQLRITNQTGEELTVKEIRLSADGGQIAYQRDYDVATGKWKTTGERKSDFLQFDALNFPALPSGGTESQDFHMLLFPEPGHSRTNMTVTVITSRGEYSRTRPAPDGGFLAAKNYLSNIVIKTDGLTAEEKWVEYITNKAELIAFCDKVNGGDKYTGKTVRLTADIDLSGETWTPIGNYSDIFMNFFQFSGTFDGGGYHISGLNVNSRTDRVGLFGEVYKGTVRNLRVSGTVTTTGGDAGGIAGYLGGNSTVENCIFSGDVSGKRAVGGIVGVCSGSRIAGCHTKGKVTATSSSVGGIVGKNSNIITDCYSEAIVTANLTNAGGIAGSNTDNGAVTHCYATGTISAKEQVGGIAGWNMKSVTGCLALNPGLTRTEGSDTRFGRIVGDNQGSATVTSCAAYDGMTITDNASQPITGTGEAGTALTRGQCLTYLAYTSSGFTEATATTPGWAFDSGTWTYLPWNPAFASFPGITDPAQYRIAVPAYLSAPVIP